MRWHDDRSESRAARDGPSAPAASPRGRRVVFASAHSIVDSSNGASVATLDALQALVPLGFECHAFCTPRSDLPGEARLERLIAESREPYQVRSSACGPHRARILYTRRREVPITVVQVDPTRQGRHGPEEVDAVLSFFRRYIDILEPDVMLTYGGDPVSIGLIDLARRRGIPVVFAIHNYCYGKGPPLTLADCRIVPSEFARRHYRDAIGLDCHALPYPVDWDRVRVKERQPRFVTFVNPVPEKGVYPFVRIAHELGRRRPDIPLLVVESRGSRGVLAACGLGRDAPVNVRIMPHTTDPRRFYALTRIALMPSLWWENQPLVAVESMINGIPVIGSDRGGIPEALGEAGLILPLPERLTPQSQTVPTAEEVEPWVEAIVRLWDDPALREEHGARALREAERWHPDRIRPLYAEFFRSVRPRTAPEMGKSTSSEAVASDAARMAEGKEAAAAARAGPLPSPPAETDESPTVPLPLALHRSDTAIVPQEPLGSSGRADGSASVVPRSEVGRSGDSNPHPGLTSIIVPCRDQLALTRLGLQALFRFTRRPWELIAVDNGSTDGTRAYLDGVRGDAPVPVTLIANARDLGFHRAVNQGLRAARGAYVVVLDGDAVVADGWLDQLIALAEADPRIGVVGTMSNTAAPPQRVDEAAPADLAAMSRFAADWRARHRGQWFEVERLSGPCLLMKRRVLDAVGGLEEGPGKGSGIDDLSVRARRAGFTLAVARDLFVHGAGGGAVGWTRVGRAWDQVPGFFDFEAVYDAAVDAAADGAVFVEVGCLAGRSTCYLGSRIRASGKRITLYGVDPATGSPSDLTGQRIAPAVGGSFAGILHRNILGCGLEDVVVPILTTSVQAAGLFRDESVDFCFIDADHSYESVAADLGAWWPKIRPGGMLAGHDYRQSAPWLVGVTAAVHDFFGVQDAAHPACASCWAMVKAGAVPDDPASADGSDRPAIAVSGPERPGRPGAHPFRTDPSRG